MPLDRERRNAMMSSPTRHITAPSVLSIEQSLRAAVPEAIFTTPRVVRRIIHADLDLPFPLTRVPHQESLLLSPARLLELADDIWALPSQMPDQILLVARPEAESFQGDLDRLLRAYWQLLAHGCFDIAARRLLAKESPRVVLDCLPQLGPLQLAEAKNVLGREGRLRDPSDRREVLAEFMAVVMELASFSPRQLEAWFPAIDDLAELVAGLRKLVDVDAILERTRPPLLSSVDPQASPQPASPLRPAEMLRPPPGGLSSRTTAFLRQRTGSAARRGNDVRGALLQWRLRWRAGSDAEARVRAERGLARRIMRLVRRLDRAVGLGHASAAEVRSFLQAIVDDAHGSAWSPSARLLYDLQKICVDSEREGYRTQLLSWAFSLGRVRLIRPLPRQRAALVHRHVAVAVRRLPTLKLSLEQAAIGNALLLPVLESTATRLRSGLAPVVHRSLTNAGLAPRFVVEEAAFDKLVGELIDDIESRGFESFGNVRDAVSRSQVKLPDLSGVVELMRGDALLRANRRLSRGLDGAYTGAPIYLSAMQRLSAIAFGIPAGRAVTLHLLLPFGGAWLFWLGLEHVVEPVSDYVLGEPVRIYSRTAVVVTGIILWLVMHLSLVRNAVFKAARGLGRGLHYAVLELPQQLLRMPVVERFLRSRPVRLFRRYLWSPLVFTALVWLLVPQEGSWASRSNRWLPLSVFVLAGVGLNAPAGRVLQELVLDVVSRAVQQIHARLIVGLLGWILDLFRKAMDFLEGMLYAVDEQLRFRTDESRAALAIKAVLTTLWAAADWVIRFCVTLLIEPQLNPIKHFPVVTVSHKLLVPMIPAVAGQLVAATGMERGLALTAVTFVSATIPGVFGFLAWELKENWRLYAANRPATLRPVQIGRHGESMRRLLVPGLHSGTIPKLHARRRRQLRADTSGAGIVAADEELHELAGDIAAFFDDECLGLLRRTQMFHATPLTIANVQLATNRVLVTIVAESLGREPMRLMVFQLDGRITCELIDAGWMTSIDANRRRLVDLALAGLACLCGADVFTDSSCDPATSRPVEPIAWQVWRDTWEGERAGSRHAREQVTSLASPTS